MGADAPSMRQMGLKLFGREDARNMVAGKIFRMGLCNRLTPDQRSQRKAVREGQPRARKAGPGRRRPQMIKGAVVLFEPYMALDITPPDRSTLCTLLDLDATKAQCRAPIGEPGTEDFRYCGTPGANMPGPYCNFHHRLFYQPGSALGNRTRHMNVGSDLGAFGWDRMRAPALECSEQVPGEIPVLVDD